MTCLPKPAFRGSRRLRVFSAPHAPVRLPSFRLRVCRRYVTCAQSAGPLANPRAVIAIRRPGRPFAGFSPTRGATTVICFDAVRVGSAASVAA
jgi:hypothetical protein